MDRILIILKTNGPRALSAPALGLNTIIFKNVYWHMSRSQVSVYRTIGPLFIYGLESRLGVLEWSWAAVLEWILEVEPWRESCEWNRKYFFLIQRNFPIWVLISIIAIPCSNRLSKIRIYQNVHE